MRIEHYTECLGVLGGPVAGLLQLFDVAAHGNQTKSQIVMVGITLLGSSLGRFPEWLTSAMRSVYERAFASHAAATDVPAEEASDSPIVAEAAPSEPRDRSRSLVDNMLYEGRYALLLRPQLIANLSDDQIERAREALADNMCVVPGGEVVVRQVIAEDDADPLADHADVLRVEAYYLDKNPVTNEEYFRFTSGGGYEQMAIWDRDIWPAVLDFVDQTGHPGPRFWREGTFPRGQERCPVVGISWYEAAAYARWVGKRLATDAEWVKAGSWPLSIPGQPPVERRFPWGEAMDRARANIWGGAGHVVTVDEYSSGTSVGGVQQLIGNVWEWTADPFMLDDTPDSVATADRPVMKSVRGGAFDTYLDSQATCHFQSGDRALARKHNVSFRCAMGWDDVAHPVNSKELPADETIATFEETHS